MKCEACRRRYSGYMLTDPVWAQAARGRDHLCLGCARASLGRPLDPADFTLCLLNAISPYPPALARCAQVAGQWHLLPSSMSVSVQHYATPVEWYIALTPPVIPQVP